MKSEEERPLFKKDYFGLELTVLIVIMVIAVLVAAFLLLAMFGEIST